MKRRPFSPSSNVYSNTNSVTPLPTPLPSSHHVPHVIKSTANHATSGPFKVFIISLLQSIPIISAPLLITDAELAQYALVFISPTPPPAQTLRLSGSDALAL